MIAQISEKKKLGFIAATGVPSARARLIRTDRLDSSIVGQYKICLEKKQSAQISRKINMFCKKIGVF